MTTAVIVTHALTQFSAAPVALALLREQIQATPTFISLIAAGTNPFANLATSLLDIGDTFKAPLAVLAFLIAGGAQALHSPRATSMWISAIIASAFLFGAKGMADYLQANVK